VADSPFEAMSTPAQTIGRYFSVLSVVPSALLVAYFLVLNNSHAWTGQPDFAAGFSSLGEGGLAKVGQIVLASLLVGLVLQPLQYALVQFAEGYWGTSKIATALMRRRIARHRALWNALFDTRRDALKNLKVAGQSPRDAGQGQVKDDQLINLVVLDEATRGLATYPHALNDIRPTRLGNVLRRFEAEAGAPYGLGLPTVAPHLTLVALPEHVEFVNDQRTQLDLAVRLVVISVLACALSVLFLWRDGLWLLVAVVPYVLAYVFYRGAVVVAADYGTALATVIDVDRFLLYQRLNVPLPTSLASEQEQSRKLMKLLRGDRHPLERANVSLAYAPPASAPARTDAGAGDNSS
jgi:hypothetical protein